MSSRVFQSVIVQMKEATDRMIGVIDADANVISCSDTSMIGEKWPEAVIRLNSAPDSIVVVGKKTFKPLVSWSAYFDYAVFAEGDDETARSLCVMAYVALNGAKTYYEEKHDKGTFVKNIITDNILPGDIYIRAKELHFVTDAAARGVPGAGRSAGPTWPWWTCLQGMFPDRQQDFVLTINETDIAIVKQITPDDRRAKTCLEMRAAAIEQTPAHGAVHQDDDRHRHRVRAICASWPTPTRRRRSPSRSARSSTPRRPSSTMKTWASAG